jgi:hypothetical protein
MPKSIEEPEVHVVDQVGREELADCPWSSADSDV